MKKIFIFPLLLLILFLAGCSNATDTSSSKTTTGYVCNCNKTCPNISCSEAQYQLTACGCSARDADRDGIACDAQCQ